MIDRRQSGLLRLIHVSRQIGLIQLDDGIIAGMMQGSRTGLEAAEIIFRWIDMAAMFAQGESLGTDQQIRLNTPATLNQLKKIDSRIAVFKEMIGGCDAVFRVSKDDISGPQSIGRREVSVLAVVDGKSSMGELLEKCEMSELDLLLTVCRLIKSGMLQQVRPHQSMSPAGRSVFMEQLENCLSDITGPVASVILQYAFQAIGISPNELVQCDIPHLFIVISYHLEEDEKEVFSNWTVSYLQAGVN